MNPKRLIILLMAIILSHGCSVIGNKSLDKEALLVKRVNDYVAFKNAQAADKEYEFLSPEYRKEINLVKYIKLQQKKIDNVVVKAVEYTPGENTANIELKADITAGGFDFKDVVFKQNWVFVENQWYYDAKIASFKQLFTPLKSSGNASGK